LVSAVQAIMAKQRDVATRVQRPEAIVRQVRSRTASGL
jgi:hypothetical protein